MIGWNVSSNTNVLGFWSTIFWLALVSLSIFFIVYCFGTVIFEVSEIEDNFLMTLVKASLKKTRGFNSSYCFACVLASVRKTRVTAKSGTAKK